jgi:hypothetical protein
MDRWILQINGRVKERVLKHSETREGEYPSDLDQQESLILCLNFVISKFEGVEKVVRRRKESRNPDRIWTVRSYKNLDHRSTENKS